MNVADVQLSTYSLRADYRMRVKTLVRLGGYDRHDDAIIGKKIRTTRKGVAHLEAVIVYFKRAVTQEEVIAELLLLGIRPGELHELLFFGAQHPLVQCQFPIIALGTIVPLDNIFGAPCLSGSKTAGRQLDFTYCGGRWGGGHRFLAFQISTDFQS